jgi:LacI family transcriptional regulator
VDGKQACRKAVNSLIDQGHRNIVVVGGERVLSDTGRQRFEGCLEAMRERDVAFDEELDYRSVRFSYQDGYDATKSLLEDGREFTALFAAADVMAIGAIRALRDAGKRVPEDVSVVGFDGLPLGSFLVPQLTTIVQPVQQMAQRSVEMLISSIEEGGEARHETVPFSLCSRESTRKI